MNRRLPSRLYAIADPGESGHDPVELTRRLLAGGASVIQLRWKHAASGALLAAAVHCRRLTALQGALFIVNDRVDVALACEADGVHLGQEDLPPAAARRLLGEARWIGVSTHDLTQARAAEAAGASYIGFGPMFPTATKATGYDPRGLLRLREVRDTVLVPIVAIGGIDASNARSALDAGADAVAMISALRDVPDIVTTVATLRGELDAA
jgi:thiamine-phosphate pyrophosphorylase